MRISPKFPLIAILLTIVFAVPLQAQFQASPASLTFTADAGKAAAAQSISLTTATSAQVSFSIAGSASQGCYKISVNPINGVTPATLNVVAETQSLPAGTYNCSITISTNAQGGGFSTVVPVTMVIGSTGGTTGNLSVAPTSLSLSVQSSFNSASAVIMLTNSTGANAIAYTATTNQSWLSVSPTSGSVSSTAGLTVTATGQGLQPGTYSATVIITPGTGNQILVAVTFVISSGPTIQLQKNGATVTAVNFAYQIGGGLPATQTFSMVSTDSTSVACTVSLGSTANYLTVAPVGTMYTPQTITISVNAGVMALSSGVYSTNLLANCPGTVNQTLSVPLNLTVSALPLLTLGSPPTAFYYQPGGTVPGSQAVSLSTTSNAVAFSVTVAYSTGTSGWLSVSPSSGATSLASPAALLVTANPTNLSTGTYSATVYVYANGAANSPVSFPVTLAVGGSTGGLSSFPSALTFNYQIGQAVPPAQSVAIASTGSEASFSTTASSQTCAGFLNVTPVSGSTPATLIVSVTPLGFTSGQICSGNIAVTTSGSATLNIPVTLNVSTSAVLQVFPTALTFTGTLGATNTSTQSLSISTSDNTSTIPFTIYSSSGWLTVAPQTGTAPTTVVVSANPSVNGLQAGANTGTLSISGTTSSATVPVTFNLSSNTSATASPSSLTFTQAYNGTAPAAQTVTITLAGGLASTPFSVNVQSGGTTSWVSVTPTSGSAPGTVTVAVNGSGIPVGKYTATLQILITGASNSPLQLPLSFTITQPATLAVLPQSLSFTGSAGGTNPPSQTLQVTSSGTTVNFGVSAVSTNCANVFSATPLNATTPATVTVSADLTGLSVGASCNGTVTVTGSGANFQNIPVTLAVTAALPTIASVANAASYASGALAPGEIVTLFGKNLGPATLTLGSFIGTRYTTTVGGTQVQFDSGLYAPIIYSRNDQLSVVVPYEVAGRLNTNIQVLYNGQSSTALQMRVADTAPGIFTAAASGTGQGSIVNQDYSINGPSAPAPKGSVVSVYMTGLGQTNPPGTTGGPGGSTQLQTVSGVTASVGGVAADVQFAGAAPTYIQGLYQVNVTVPPLAASGSQPVVIAINGVTSSSGVTMWVQ